MGWERHRLVVLSAVHLGAFDTNELLFGRAGDSVVPMYAWADTGREYVDVVELANARCSHVGLGEQLKRLGGPPGFVFDLNPATGRVRITGPEPFDIEPGDGNAAWGFDPDGHNSVGNVIEAPNDWKRGNVSARFTLSVGLGYYALPWAPYEAQDVPTVLRIWTADLDSKARRRCLEDLDNRANDYDDEPEPDGVHSRVRHYISDAGRYTVSWPDGVGLGELSWLASELADMLGFRGDEVAELGADGVWRLAATWAPRSMLWTDYHGPLRWVRREIGDAQTMPDGGVVSVHQANQLGLRLKAWIQGVAAGEDVADHFLHEWLPTAPRGGVVTVVQRWGDTRRFVRPREAARRGLGPHDLRWTTDERAGRIICQVHPKQPVEVVEKYEDDELDVYLAVQLELNVMPDSEVLGA